MYQWACSLLIQESTPTSKSHWFNSRWKQIKMTYQMFRFSNQSILEMRNAKKKFKRNGLPLHGFVFATIHLVDWLILCWQLHRIIFGTRRSHLPFHWNNQIPTSMKNLRWRYSMKKKYLHITCMLESLCEYKYIIPYLFIKINMVFFKFI